MTHQPKAPPPSAGMLGAFPEHAQRIGILIAGWSSIEHAIILLVAIVTKTPQNIVIPMMYAIKSSRGRLKVAGVALTRFIPKGDPNRAAADAILKEADSVLTQRDKYAHAIFVKGEGLFVFRRHASEVSEEVKLHDLDHQLRRAHELETAVMRLMATIAGHFDAQVSPPSR